MKRKKNAVTLLELIIALSIFSLMFLAFASIQLFSRFHFLNSSRRASLQNEVMYVLEHMARHITGTNAQGGAIGNVGGPPVSDTTITGKTGFNVRVDSNGNGSWDAADVWIGYAYDSSNKILFYADVSDTATYEALTQSRIMGDLSTTSANDTYAAYNYSYNYLKVQITARWDPSKPETRENPQVVMSSRIKMPAVSTQ
jgi:prepilin-type N-terminal cleavage/methylation domain-containing protein